MSALQDDLEFVLHHYLESVRTIPFGHDNEIARTFKNISQAISSLQRLREAPSLVVKWSVGQGVWAKVPWIVILDREVTSSVQDGVYVVLLFRADMSGVYLTLNQGVTKLIKEKGRKQARADLRERARSIRHAVQELTVHGFAMDDSIDLRTSGGLGADYKPATIAHKLVRTGSVDADALMNDIVALIDAYQQWSTNTMNSNDGKLGYDTPKDPDPSPASRAMDLDLVIQYIRSSGFIFEPWQIACYVTALRTKPFAILAGVSGTGKSKLPSLVAEATGGKAYMISVTPDWTDSSSLLGYYDLQQVFREGELLPVLRQAYEQPHVSHVCILDEMNLARVEYYLAEVLSKIEDRFRGTEGGYSSHPLIGKTFGSIDEESRSLGIPPNLSIVGTVNMDETTHGFSRKVLDRAFTIELSDIRLGAWKGLDESQTMPTTWPTAAWFPRALRISQLTDLSTEETKTVERVVQELEAANRVLAGSQLQIGYRVRDEIALFLLHAQSVSKYFITAAGEVVDPMDLALNMKILPRLSGGTTPLRRTVLQLLSWSWNGTIAGEENDIEDKYGSWRDRGRPSRVPEAR